MSQVCPLTFDLSYLLIGVRCSDFLYNAPWYLQVQRKTIIQQGQQQHIQEKSFVLLIFVKVISKWSLKKRALALCFQGMFLLSKPLCNGSVLINQQTAPFCVLGYLMLEIKALQQKTQESKTQDWTTDSGLLFNLPPQQVNQSTFLFAKDKVYAINI